MALETVPIMPTTDSLVQKKNRIQVSNTKKPLFFYVNLAKVSILIVFPVFHIRSLQWFLSDLATYYATVSQRRVCMLCSRDLIARLAISWCLLCSYILLITRFILLTSVWLYTLLVIAHLCTHMQRYIRQHNEVELSALGMGKDPLQLLPKLVLN